MSVSSRARSATAFQCVLSRCLFYYMTKFSALQLISMRAVLDDVINYYPISYRARRDAAFEIQFYRHSCEVACRLLHCQQRTRPWTNFAERHCEQIYRRPASVLLSYRAIIIAPLTLRRVIIQTDCACGAAQRVFIDCCMLIYVFCGIVNDPISCSRLMSNEVNLNLCSVMNTCYGLQECLVLVMFMNQEVWTISYHVLESLHLSLIFLELEQEWSYRVELFTKFSLTKHPSTISYFTLYTYFQNRFHVSWHVVSMSV